MNEKKVVKEMEKIVLKYLYDKPEKIAQEIYNNRKKLGLFTKQDISKENTYDEDGNIVEIEID